jgi:hypothetical protein
MRHPGVCGHRRAYSAVAPALVTPVPQLRIHCASAAEIVQTKGLLLGPYMHAMTVGRSHRRP